MNDIPRRRLFAVIEREGLAKGIWSPIGAAFQNRDGSWNLKFDLMPTDPKMTIQMREERDDGEAEIELPEVEGLVTIEAGERCGRYHGYTLEGASIGPSPMASLLDRSALSRASMCTINRKRPKEPCLSLSGEIPKWPSSTFSSRPKTYTKNPVLLPKRSDLPGWMSL